MGPGKSKSTQATTVTAPTTTNVGDIGLTGEDAVAFAAVINAGAIAQTQAIGRILRSVPGNPDGTAYTPLISGAGNQSLIQPASATRCRGKVDRMNAIVRAS